jgi:hypothetical protein
LAFLAGHATVRLCPQWCAAIEDAGVRPERVPSRAGARSAALEVGTACSCPPSLETLPPRLGVQHVGARSARTAACRASGARCRSASFSLHLPEPAPTILFRYLRAEGYPTRRHVELTRHGESSDTHAGSSWSCRERPPSPSMKQTPAAHARAPRACTYGSRATQDDTVHLTECEFEVAVGEGGFTFAGCWGSDKTMTYDRDDREYPFKGRTDGTLLWLAPSR